MPDEITIDGLEEHAFRRSIETLLRYGRADEAADRLRALLPDLCGEGMVLPARLLDVTTADVKFGGLDRIAAKLDEYGRAESPITAIGIGIGDPQDTGLAPDENGNLHPPLETTYYSDATFPFSETDRDDLLEGYSSYGCEWQGDYDRIDDAISVEGIDDLYGAIAALENKVGSSGNPSPEDIRAGAIGACYLGVLVYQAAREAVIQHGLPRPLTILLVNSDAYPFFDAPVLTFDEYRDDGTVKVIDRAPAMATASDDPFDAEEPDDSASLMNIVASSPHATNKKMALALEGDEAHNPLGMADELISQAAFDPDSVDLSRFMPQDTFEAEPPMEDPGNTGWEPRAPSSGESDQDENTQFSELEFPVETLLPGHADTAPPDDIPVEEPLDPQSPNPYVAPPDDEAPDQPRDAAFDPWAAGEARPRFDSDYDPRPTEASQPPAQPEPAAWHEQVDPSASFDTADGPEATGSKPEAAGPDGAGAEGYGVHMPWLDNGEVLPYGQSVPPPAPAAHSIRAKIRVAEPTEQAPSGLAGLFAALARLIKRVQDLLLRR